MTKALINVRCPYEVVNKKTSRRFSCNRLCVKVSAGAVGEAFCPSCKRRFEFVLTDQASDMLPSG